MPNIVDPTIPNYPPQGIQAQLDLLYLYNPDVAQKLIDQLNAGLADMEAFKKEVVKALQDLQGVLRYKGSVETEADLPTEGNVIGDVWNITSTDVNVAWNGTSWDKFGSAIDTSVFLTKTDAADTYLPLTGGELTGELTIQPSVYTSEEQTVLTLNSLMPSGEPGYSADIKVTPGVITAGLDSRLVLPGTTVEGYLLGRADIDVLPQLGSPGCKWDAVYVKKVNNGADLAVPTTGGTLARLEDIPAAEVTSVNTKKGDVVLTGADINATLTGTGAPVTATVTEHLQTLKNDETELGNQVSNIQALIPSDASETNLLATKGDIGGGTDWFQEFTYTRQEGEDNPIKLIFSIPATIPDGTYAFKVYGLGQPYSSIGGGLLFTRKIRHVKFVVSGGSVTDGIAYFAQSDEQGYTTDFSALNNAESFIVYRKSDMSGFVLSACADSGSDIGRFGAAGVEYKTCGITKIKNVDTGAEIEPQNIQQFAGWNDYPESYVSGQSSLQEMFRIYRQALAYLDATPPGWSGMVGPGAMLNIQGIPITTQNNGWAPYGTQYAAIQIVDFGDADPTTGMPINNGEYVFSVACSIDGNPYITELRKSGTFADRVVRCGYNQNTGDANLLVCFEDQKTISPNTYVGIGWYGQPFLGSMIYVTSNYEIPEELTTVLETHVGAGGAVDSVNGKTGAVVLSATDVSAVATNQGVVNAGKFLKVDAEGQVIASAEAAGGGLVAVAHDDSLSGAGTDADPLRLNTASFNNGVAGDYHTHFGIIDSPNGLPTRGTGNTIDIPAGLVLSIPGSDSYVTLGSAEKYEPTSTVDCTLFYARETDGTNAMYIEATDVHYSVTEPPLDGVTGFQAWYSPAHGKWQMRSNDTGNVWRDIVGGPICDLKFLDNNLVRIDFIGYRILNTQEFATKADIGNIGNALDTINGEVL